MRESGGSGSRILVRGIERGGFTLTGVVDSLDGINVSGYRNTRIHNGALFRWGEAGVVLGVEGVARDLWIGSSGAEGILALDRARVVDCELVDNVSTSLLVGDSSFVSHCRIQAIGSDGVSAGLYSELESVVVSGGSTRMRNRSSGAGVSISRHWTRP